MWLPRLVIASGNPGKIREFRRMLGDRVGEIVSKEDLGIGEIPETADTFVENAIAKARHVAGAAGSATLAEDSGICVDALSGRPGVRSARMSEAGDEKSNNARLLEELEGVSGRSAHYHCSMVLMRSAADPAPLVAEADWHGSIATAPRGGNGFGYDPLFVTRDGRTAAELAPEEKDALSHRGNAVRAMVALIERREEGK